MSGGSDGVSELLATAAELGIRLWVEDGRLAYDAPRGALTPELRGALRARRDELVERLQRQDDAAAPGGDRPLTSAQRGMWFLDRLGASAAYNVGLVLRLTGPLRTAALRDALHWSVARHAALRTAFPCVDGQPVQRVAPTAELSFEEVDLRHVEEAQRQQELCRCVDDESARPFDLASGRLFRARLYRLADDQHVLHCTVHHIVFDWWSWEVLQRELSEGYEASSSGRAPRLPALVEAPVEHAEAVERHLPYWRERLRGLSPSTLPTDRPRAAVWNFRGAHVDLELPAPLVSAFRELGRGLGATPAMLLLAAFKVLLARYSGSEDIAVGVPVANRNETRVENLIGLFVNTLVLRTDLGGDPTFVDAVQRVRRTSLEAFDHQVVPFERLVEELAPGRDTSQNPLFQVGFQLQQEAGGGLHLRGVSVSPEPFEVRTARVDLELHLFERKDSIRGKLVFCPDLFDAATMRGFARHYVQLLESAVATPQARLSELQLMSSAEQATVIVDWNRSDAPPSDGRCVHERIEERVRRAPDAPALIWEGGELSYRELNERSNRVAWTLREHGVGPDVLVGLCFSRGPDLVVGLLGVLKAGGAYVPLDPEYPPQRLRFMATDSAVSLLLTQERHLAALPADGARALCFDRDAARFARASADDPPAVATAGNLAYAIYTSGSTGTPKGALLEHRGLANLAAQQARTFGVTAASRVLQFSSPSFDAATFEIMMALPAGAALVLRPSGVLPGPGLLELLRRHRVSIVTLPPVALAALPVQALPHLEAITVAGEVCSAELVRRWAPGRRFFNLYGPTEATIWSTVAPAEADAAGATVPIGRPIGSVTAYVLDAQLRPVPAGVIGELCVGGAGVGRGYLRRAALTAERFAPDPFAQEPGARLYRTGDLARHRADGALEFVGRIDQQVKLRGYRIEPGEIEAALLRHPRIEDVVVVCRDDSIGERQLVAYVVESSGQKLSRGELRRFLAGALPEHMIPAAFVRLDALPVTPAGKVDRRALPALDRAPPEAATAVPRSELERRIAQIWCDVLGRDRVGLRDAFFEVGGHSLRLVQLQGKLERELGRGIAIAELFRHPTVEAMAALLEGVESEVRTGPLQKPSEPIAVIAVAGRFPGAPDVETLWSNLCAGVESVRFSTVDELRRAGVDETLLANPDFVRAHGALDGPELFDARLFGYSPREAQIMDPQQRVFLECAWEALERAGCDPARYPGAIGVYAGAGRNDYLQNVQSHPELAFAGGLEGVVATDKDFLSTRVSYKLNLRGPSMTVQTACSTSLVAVHEACRALQDRQCDIALAGGAAIFVPQVGGYIYREGDISSPDGHCRPFDASARGTLRGDGVGIAVLKRLDDALRDGDPICAVIRGTAVNNDGADKVGYTAPSVEGQARVIAMAHAAAGIDPGTIGYVEAHGTATPLGDPIEVAALTRAFRAGTERTGFCGLGSVKSNLGHLDAAAGVTGLIKAVLALQHGRLPPSLHFEQPNSEIDFANSPFYVVTEARDWAADGGTPRRAGVSSFGIGGTNAHVVLEEAPPREPSGPSRPWQVLPLSAKTAAALDELSLQLAARLREDATASLADVTHTLQVGRHELEVRRAHACGSVSEAVLALAGERPDATWHGVAPDRPRRVAFLFPGHGHQYPRMGLGLYRSEPVFAEAVDRCIAHLDGELDFDLRAALFPERELEAARDVLLSRPAVFQPAVFIIDYAAARLWQSWGIQPAACLGHSLGEYVAAAVASVLSVEDALRLVVLRGRLMEQTPPGAMLSIALSEERVRELIAGEGAIWLSTINAPELCIVAGAPPSIDELERRTAAAGIECSRLHATHAYHSGMMESGVEPLAAAVRACRVEAPRLPYLSNVSGDWITAEQVRDPGYWGRHLAAPVRFSDGMSKLLEDPELVLLETGPGRMLSSLARKQPACTRDRVVVSSLPHPDSEVSDEAFAAEGLGRLWTGGVRVDWESYRAGERRRRAALPVYPFERQRYWVERRPLPGARPRRDVAEWFYAPVWRPSRWAKAAQSRAGEGCIAVLAAGDELSARVVRRLAESGRPVVTVAAAAAFAHSGSAYSIDPGSRDHYARLWSEIESEHGRLGDVVHLWTAAFDAGRPSDDAAEQIQKRGLHSVLHLLAVIDGRAPATPVGVHVVTDGVHEVTLDEDLCPEKATVLGPCRIAGLELRSVVCRNLDLAAAAGLDDRTIDLLVEELLAPRPESMVAFRRGRRFVQSFAAVHLDAVEGVRARRLRPRGTYLLTGGLGGIGLQLAAELARSVQARLIITGRTPLPERGDWADHRAAHGDDETSRRISAIEAMEAAGAEVLVTLADVCDEAAMQAAVAAGVERFGRIDGVIHLAGEPGGAAIAATDAAAVDRVLLPKVAGTRVLERLFAATPLDFMVLASSIITSWGMRGLVDYCAANAYLDAFARRFAADTGTFTIALDWARWREVGMAALAAAERGQRAALLGITNAEGVEVFRRVLDRADEPQLLVSDVEFRDPLQSRVDAADAQGLDDARAGDSAPAHQRPAVSTEFATPRNEIERKLASLWEARLGIESIGVHDNFFELGGDSVQAIHIVSAAREAGIGFTVKDLLTRQTVAAVASMASTTARLDAEQGPVTGPVALTPTQRWFFDQDPVDPEHFNVTLLLQAQKPVDPAALTATLDALAWHHDALRLRCRLVDGAWQQAIAPPGAGIPLQTIDLRDTPPAERDREIARCAGEIQASLDLAEGPIARAALFRSGAGEPDRLLVAVHHIATDIVSLGILLDDLARGLQQQRGQALLLPRKTTSIRAWGEHFGKIAATPAVRDAALAWLDLPWPKACHLPIDHPGLDNTVGSAARVTTTLSAQQTAALLRGAKGRSDARVDDVLLAALAICLADATRSDRVLLDVETHGRESDDAAIDVSRTVGWFTSIYPVLLDVTGSREPSSVLPLVSEQMRWFREHELSYRLARYMRRDDALAAQLRSLPRPEFLFVYHGQLDQMVVSGDAFRWERADIGPSRSPRARRCHAIEIEGAVSEGRLQVSWIYSGNAHREATIRALADRFLACLESLIPAGAAVESMPASAAASFGWSDHDVGDLAAEIERLRE